MMIIKYTLIISLFNDFDLQVQRVRALMFMCDECNVLSYISHFFSKKYNCDDLRKTN